MKIEKILYSSRPVRYIITDPSECGKSVFSTILILNIISGYDKRYIYSPSLHQDLYRNLIKCFCYYKPIHIIPKFFNEEDIDLVFDQVVNNEDFQKPDTELETYESIEELKVPQEFDD